MVDVLVVGAGPAGLAIAAALCNAGLKVMGVTPAMPEAAWTNTYGIWCDELDPLGLTGMLSHRWTDCSVYVGGREIDLRRDYGLFANDRLQAHLLAACERGGMIWHKGVAAGVEHGHSHSMITTRDGNVLPARLVVDASGHEPVFVHRPPAAQVAYQAAYGIAGAFSAPPVRSNQLVLMDYRSHHLSPTQRAGPPTFLYAMDLGQHRYFVEETSLAHHPAVSFEVLEQRLHRRLAHMGVQVDEIHHTERCLFPMNLPLPSLDQPVLGYGGAASMVHPASGYQVGAALTRAPVVAHTIAQALDAPFSSPVHTACTAWRALWPGHLVRRRNLYLFGLENVLRFDEQQTQDFFATFFQLPYSQWTGYLSNMLSTAELLHTMLLLFSRAPNHVRKRLVGSAGSQSRLLWRALVGK